MSPALRRALRRLGLLLLAFVVLYILGIYVSYKSEPDAFSDTQFVSIKEVIPGGEDAATVRLVRSAVEAVDEEAKIDGFHKRDAHAKPHGCLKATFTVVEDTEEEKLPENLRKGLFQQPGKRYNAWLRFSNGTQADDREPDARGLGIKLLEVTEPPYLQNHRASNTKNTWRVKPRKMSSAARSELLRREAVGRPLRCWSRSGEPNPVRKKECFCWKPEGRKSDNKKAADWSSHETERPGTRGNFRDRQAEISTCFRKDPAAPINQDFNLINYPVFFLPDVQAYEEFFGYQVAHDPIPYFLDWNPLKWKTRGLLNAARNIYAEVGSPLDPTYYSMTAFKLGDLNVKYAVAPVTCEATGRAAGPAKTPIPSDATKDFLRNALMAEISTRKHCFDFQAQLQDPTSNMPIEDPTVEWKEHISPYVTLARIEVPKQFLNNERLTEFCEQLSISPWNGTTAHRPLGGLNRVRRVVYDAVSTRRHVRNNYERHEPHDNDWCLDLDGPKTCENPIEGYGK